LLVWLLGWWLWYELKDPPAAAAAPAPAPAAAAPYMWAGVPVAEDAAYPDMRAEAESCA
jgi:hypothetical protein